MLFQRFYLVRGSFRAAGGTCIDLRPQLDRGVILLQRSDGCFNFAWMRLLELSGNSGPIQQLEIDSQNLHTVDYSYFGNQGIRPNSAATDSMRLMSCQIERLKYNLPFLPY